MNFPLGRNSFASCPSPLAYICDHFPKPRLPHAPSLLGLFARMSSSYFPGGMGDGEEQLHVLAVDDSVTERKFLERLLKNSDYKVTIAENGQKALEHLGLLGDTKQSNLEANYPKVNLIITDYCMPGMTGYELLKRIKESPNLKKIPVVVMSSENIPTRIEKCMEDGAEEFMLKPLQQSDVNRLRCHMTKLDKQWSRRICLRR